MIKRLPKLRVSITEKCQLHCQFCGGPPEAMENFQPDYLFGTSLEREQLLKVLRAYVATGGEYVQFTGGEPLLFRGIAKLVEQVRELGAVPEINSNGVTMRPALVRDLASAGLNVLKISLPSFTREGFAESTGLDRLPKVLDNMRMAQEFLKIRVNTVAVRSKIDEIPLAIETCRSFGIPEILFLELLYYYDRDQSASREYFFSEYVDPKEVQAIVAANLGGEFSTFGFFEEYGAAIESCTSPRDGFTAYTKSAATSLRLPECDGCPFYCQEGLYQLRLSTGGYLSFCNVPNMNGHETRDMSGSEVENIFTGYLKRFGSESFAIRSEDFFARIQTS
ncbi:radical SAM protein [Actinospica sp. MGRD01-02]|uniref:Radical SAM protein n=1 Tax=Actinospica acidithermotolerans TaxID=2828514 RepID=A0A941IJR8_9ACTN|nr:radical SAM protein [Actinospica acidithermotolerans]MBR7825986.1 radical SAM protein [Actinospica acidithermotolerans]